MQSESRRSTALCRNPFLSHSSRGEGSNERFHRNSWNSPVVSADYSTAVIRFRCEPQGDSSPPEFASSVHILPRNMDFRVQMLNHSLVPSSFSSHCHQTDTGDSFCRNQVSQNEHIGKKRSERITRSSVIRNDNSSHSQILSQDFLLNNPDSLSNSLTAPKCIPQQLGVPGTNST